MLVLVEVRLLLTLHQVDLRRHTRVERSRGELVRIEVGAATVAAVRLAVRLTMSLAMALAVSGLASHFY